jgi:hypothetical protein
LSLELKLPKLRPLLRGATCMIEVIGEAKMSKPWILTTPASRGIGHALTRYLLLNTRAPIVATARHDTEDVHWSLLDGLRKYVANRSDFEAMKERLKVMDLDVEGTQSTI